MTESDKTPTPADLAKQPGGQAGPDAEALARMNQPIDVKAEYTIPGAAIVELYKQIDEIPMKYARVILPILAMNIDRPETKQD